jgi:anti-sigma-K factor RskA
MSSPDDKSRFEELAALNAVGLLDEAGRRELLAAAERDVEISRLVDEFHETANQLAYEAPEVPPPASLREKIFRDLPAQSSSSKIVPFHNWLPFAVAACLMALAISQSTQIGALKKQLTTASSDIKRLSASNAYLGLQLQMLDAKDPAATDPTYAASKIMVAWDPNEHRGVVALQNLPNPPAGHDYQLWVLDPSALAPVSAGIVTASRAFAVQPIHSGSPGFAVSLEPAGGRPEPTGPILFAVAPGP